jgi:hypothetical protein
MVQLKVEPKYETRFFNIVKQLFIPRDITFSESWENGKNNKQKSTKNIRWI